MTVPIIPRKFLFGNPNRTMVRISPDGQQIAWLAPRDGVLNVWVAPRQDLDAARPVTNDTGRGIRLFTWAYTNNHVLFIQDKDGDENWRLYRVDLSSDTVSDLTPFEGIQARIQQLSPDYPDEALITINNRDPQWHDLHRVNIHTGKTSLIFENNLFLELVTDGKFNLRAAISMTSDGGIYVFQPEGDNWQKWDSIPPEDALTSNVLGFDKTGQVLFITDSRGRNTSALFEQNYVTGDKKLLAEDPQADAGDVIRHPTEKHVQAVSFTYTRKRWQILDPTISEDFNYLKTVTDGDAEVVSRSLDDLYWIVAYIVDDGAVQYYLYDRDARQANFLFTDRPELDGKPLVKMHPAVIKTRDGLDMVVYYSLPIWSDGDSDGIPDEPLPFVLLPHGGPWARDFWGYNPWHQWLANRGYAVLFVNFRSSTGFGKTFTNAGDLEWGGKILEDQVDAVEWAISQAIADPQKIAIMGGSFGGYSTLAGLTFYPELYACGVDVVGPSNLITLLESVPEYWKPMLDLLTSRVGDHRTEEGRALLVRHSPLTYVDRIQRPLLIGQGANDPRVKQAESDQIVEAMQAKNIPVTYVLYPDEGHGFARPENNLSFNAIAEAFLAEYLGGHCEPIGDDFENSSLQVLTGAESVPGLQDVL